MTQKIAERRQTEVCPWCKDTIYVFPGMYQPCPRCTKRINVYASNGWSKKMILQELSYAFEAAREELKELEKALSENLKVNGKTLELSRARFEHLQHELKKIKSEI